MGSTPERGDLELQLAEQGLGDVEQLSAHAFALMAPMDLEMADQGRLVQVADLRLLGRLQPDVYVADHFAAPPGGQQQPPAFPLPVQPLREEMPLAELSLELGEVLGFCRTDPQFIDHCPALPPPAPR